MKEIKHIFFDLDHTLWDFEANSRQALMQLYAEFKMQDLGLKSAEEFIRIYEEENHRSWSLFREGKMSKEDLRHGRFSRAFAHLGLGDSQSKVMGEEYLKISPFQTNLMPGTLEALEYLKSKNVVLHILTNGFEEVQHIKVEKSGLKPYFDEVITSDRIGVKKPDPLAFHRAKDQTGLRKEPIAMIGDHLEADVLGAMNVGWKGIYYNPQKVVHTEKIDHEVNHLNELQKIF